MCRTLACFDKGLGNAAIIKKSPPPILIVVLAGQECPLLCSIFFVNTSIVAWSMGVIAMACGQRILLLPWPIISQLMLSNVAVAMVATFMPSLDHLLAVATESR
jgi:hypothetical protein